MTDSLEEWRAKVEQRLDRGSEHMDLIDQAIEENTRITMENTRITAEGNAVAFEIRDILATGKTAVRVLNWIGRTFTVCLVWAGKIAAAALALWGVFYAFTHGGKPPT